MFKWPIIVSGLAADGVSLTLSCVAVTVLRLADDGKYKEEKATIPVEVASLEEPAAVEEVPAAEPVAEATPIVEPVVNPQSITINGIEYVPATA